MAGHATSNPLMLPNVQRPPGYWRHETSGVLRPVVEAYLQGDRLDMFQIGAMRAYLRQWIESDAWDQNPRATPGNTELAGLRHDVNLLYTQRSIHAWISRAIDLGMDPL